MILKSTKIMEIFIRFIIHHELWTLIRMLKAFEGLVEKRCENNQRLSNQKLLRTRKKEN